MREYDLLRTGSRQASDRAVIHDDNLHSTQRESSDMITRRFLKASTLIMRKNRCGNGTNANNKSLANPA